MIPSVSSFAITQVVVPFFINGKPVFNNSPRNKPRSLPNFITLDS